MTLKEMEEKRRQRGYTFRQIAELSGLPEETVVCALGELKFPGYEAMQKLEKIFCRFAEQDMKKGPDMIKEAMPAYAAESGPYTLKDYFAMPEERRVELIDGVIYDMTAPHYRHQTVIGYLFTTIYNYVQNKKGNCIVFMAPVDVQLDCDEKTMVQPDIVVLCDQEKLIGYCIVGAPDFLIEVLSESTRKKDMTIKLHKYRSAGVREYWMVDRKNEKVIVYHFETSDVPVIYDFGDQVPVGIYKGSLEIDFRKVKEALAQFKDSDVKSEKCALDWQRRNKE